MIEDWRSNCHFQVSNLLVTVFTFSRHTVILEYSKTVTYDDGPKMKRDASVKVVFFLPKKTTFTEASSLHFRPVDVRYGFSCQVDVKKKWSRNFWKECMQWARLENPYLIGICQNGTALKINSHVSLVFFYQFSVIRVTQCFGNGTFMLSKVDLMKIKKTFKNF